MKVYFLVVLVALVVYVRGETCSSNKDCASHGITTCGGSFQVGCHNGHCECLLSGSTGACKMVSDCPRCDHGRREHCVDGQCRCSKF